MLTRIKTRLSFSLIYNFSKVGGQRFRKACSNVEYIQRRKLAELLKYGANTEFGKKHSLGSIRSWEDFNEKLPITKYEDWAPLVEKQKQEGGSVLSGQVCDRYQPTSGSTSKMKWIPYTQKFLNELDEAVSPMLVENFRNEKRLFRGKQYWSLSWIPTDHRKEGDDNMNDDLKLLPWYKRFLMAATTAVPNGVSFVSTSEGSMMGTLAHLVAERDLTFISVWSPTFALNMFEQLKLYRLDLAEILEKGDWGKWKELSFLRCPKSAEGANILKNWDGTISSDFMKILWPKMAMVSSWDTSTSSIWAKELKELFPGAVFVGKGLWTTEGVVTIPYEGKYPLAVTSHFYEFLDLETGKVHPSWDLYKGQVVKPLLTTGSGFFRYAINDRIRVSGFIDTCPCFEFLGRIGDVDMVGEKMSPDIAMNIIEKAGQRFDIPVLSMLAVTNRNNGSGKPYYLLLCEEEKKDETEKDAGTMVEELLQESFHYKLARDLNQLAPAKALFHSEARKFYQEIAVKQGMILGDMKIEPLRLVTENI
ncbi:MAG: GH3 auxin-responsive promoter family protein [bacterium]|nr:GH3 auxin-responsive promoter family protein [bacterium]